MGALYPLERTDAVGPIVRHVGEIDTGHNRRGCAAARVRGAGTKRGCKERGSKCFPHLHLLICLATTFRLLVSVSGSALAAPEIGEAVPALVLTTLDGISFDLAKLRGKVVLINYWATWCAPCRKEMPKLDAFYQRYRNQGLEIIGISIDFPRDFAKVRKAAAAVHYPTAVASAITDDGFGKPKGVPVTWIIDGDGKVRDMMIDVRDELLDQLVVPLLPH
jgi:cytochrome c biogenesis protein CcmG, thiol:disulfide interchange protein DsbE